jgi:hypothetical protein
MTGPRFSLELLLMMADCLREANGELCYGDFNSFVQVNRALYSCLNPMLWKSAAEHQATTARVLEYMIRKNDLAGLKNFLAAGADVQTPLLCFSDFCKPSIARGPLFRPPVPLLFAAHFDNVPMARLLLECGAKFLPYNLSCYSAIHAARSAEMVQLFLDHHADPNQKDHVIHNQSRSPLHHYAVRNNLEAMRVLLQNGARVNPGGPQWTPLHDAAAHGHIDAVTLLLENGASVTKKSNGGSRPLHAAAQGGQVEVVQLLFERWPKAMWKRNANTLTPLHCAVVNGKVDVVRLLVGLWPGGRKAQAKKGLTPLMLFKTHARYMVDEAGEAEMIALLDPVGSH